MTETKYLLDVSTLVALLWQNHSDHNKVTAWCAGKKVALCPITELGFLRVATSPAYNAAMAQARATLGHFLNTQSPEFISADARALDGAAAPSSGKTTDWYLANLAERNEMKWATLDAGADHPNAELVS